MIQQKLKINIRKQKNEDIRYLYTFLMLAQNS